MFDKAAAYKEHVGRSLFGLNVGHYDEVLRLLYWLRQPQVGEDIEPSRLADQLAQSLPQLDEQAVKTAGDTFDELTAYGEQIERRAVAAEALASLAEAYSRYARAAVAARGRVVVAAVKDERKLRSLLRRRRAELDALHHRLETAERALERPAVKQSPTGCGPRNSRPARRHGTSADSASSPPTPPNRPAAPTRRATARDARSRTTPAGPRRSRRPRTRCWRGCVATCS